ncbi:MAG: hypothetical protein J5564_01985, partial [Clostridia bacterium]|nr:hypothetical protein [Clostridia bacterium]
IRRAVRYGMELGLGEGFTAKTAQEIIDQYKDVYPELEQNAAFVLEQLTLEEGRFARTLKQGEKEFEKVLFNINRTRTAMDKIISDSTLASAEEAVKTHVLRPQPDMLAAIEAVQAGDLEAVKRECTLIRDRQNVIDGRSAFKLYDTYGFPIEITKELAAEHGLTVDEEDFKKRFEQHQATSRSGAEQIFKGGLADHSEQTTCLHTATHLLQAALRKVLGDEVGQKGSNITAEHLRFDFTFGRKVTPEELKEVERLVNEAIEANVPITMEEMTVPEAKAQGAIGLFESKYGEIVRVYTMGSFSKEICGGPHANRTGDLVSFKILKEEASSAGVRRIKATIGRKAE